MGFFTWQPTKKTRREAQGFRRDVPHNAAVDRAEARIGRMNEAVMALPQEGKDQIKVLRESYWVRKSGRFVLSSRQPREQEEVIRKYTQPKGYEEV